jgi:geranylgeranyl diphosphate synthase, type I
MHLTKYQNNYLPQIEQNLQLVFAAFDFGASQQLKEMLAYHMGWRDDGSHGKRLRPFMTLLCTQALGGEAANAMPAALAIEFLHNFSLIHDDIEDRSPLRHGRETLWMRYSEAHAINAGDALFSIAQIAMLDLEETASPHIVIETARHFNQTCWNLTCGQFLDLAFEEEEEISIEAYIDMIWGKTAALIAFSTAVAGLITGSGPDIQEKLTKYGESLGLAFQIQDDALGIWGNPDVTGKSIASDLLARKNTLPILFGLQNCDEFREMWQAPETTPDCLKKMSDLLDSCGAREFVRHYAEKFTNDAFQTLEALFPLETPENKPAQALFELSSRLLGRNL